MLDSHDESCETSCKQGRLDTSGCLRVLDPFVPLVLIILLHNSKIHHLSTDYSRIGDITPSTFLCLLFLFLLTMLPHQLPPNQQPPYTATLSMLRKIDLIRLSLELKLPTDGSVVNLRDRLRVYLNAHSDTLFRNPRYNALYPKVRRPRQPPPLPTASSQPLSYRSPSPSESDRSDSSTRSFESWHGITNEPQHQAPAPQLPQLPLQRSPSPPPQNPVPLYHPPPSPSVHDSEQSYLPPENNFPPPRKLILSHHPPSFLLLVHKHLPYSLFLHTSVAPSLRPLPPPPPLIRLFLL